MNDEYEERKSAIDYYRPFFREAGFGDYAIDFSGIEPELIIRLGEEVRNYVNRDREEIIK